MKTLTLKSGAHFAKAKIVRFERLRQSGITNMFARSFVCEVCSLSFEDYAFILENYAELMQLVKEDSK